MYKYLLNYTLLFCKTYCICTCVIVMLCICLNVDANICGRMYDVRVMSSDTRTIISSNYK